LFTELFSCRWARSACGRTHLANLAESMPSVTVEYARQSAPRRLPPICALHQSGRGDCLALPYPERPSYVDDARCFLAPLAPCQADRLWRAWGGWRGRRNLINDLQRHPLALRRHLGLTRCTAASEMMQKTDGPNLHSAGFAARETQKRSPQKPARGHVRFNGCWGFRWY